MGLAHAQRRLNKTQCRSKRLILGIEPDVAHSDTTNEVAAGILPASEGGFQPPGHNAHAPVASSATSAGLEATAHRQTGRPPLRWRCRDAPNPTKPRTGTARTVPLFPAVRSAWDTAVDTNVRAAVSDRSGLLLLSRRTWATSCCPSIGLITRWSKEDESKIIRFRPDTQ